MTAPQVEYRTDPSQYRHIKLSFDGATAQLAIDIDENRVIVSYPINLL